MKKPQRRMRGDKMTDTNKPVTGQMILADHALFERVVNKLIAETPVWRTFKSRWSTLEDKILKASDYDKDRVLDFRWKAKNMWEKKHGKVVNHGPNLDSKEMKGTDLSIKKYAKPNIAPRTNGANGRTR
jgi:hypothetical protein